MSCRSSKHLISDTFVALVIKAINSEMLALLDTTLYSFLLRGNDYRMKQLHSAAICPEWCQRVGIQTRQTGGIAFKFTRLQFSVRLASAMTSNKAQGQSVNYVGLDLRHPFELYVALSRATSRNCVGVTT
jgi:hypothetical protein